MRMGPSSETEIRIQGGTLDSKTKDVYNSRKDRECKSTSVTFLQKLLKKN